MKNNRYCTIRIPALKTLDISVAEFAFLDIIYHLQVSLKNRNPGWSNAKLDFYADSLNISRRGIQKMKKRLTDRGLIHLHETNQIAMKVDLLFEEIAIEGVNKVQVRGEQSVPRGVNKVYPKGEQSVPPTYKDIEKDISKTTTTSPNENSDSGKSEKPKRKIPQKEKGTTIEATSTAMQQFADFTEFVDAVKKEVHSAGMKEVICDAVGIDPDLFDSELESWVIWHDKKRPYFRSNWVNELKYLKFWMKNAKEFNRSKKSNNSKTKHNEGKQQKSRGSDLEKSKQIYTTEDWQNNEELWK